MRHHYYITYTQSLHAIDGLLGSVERVRNLLCGYLSYLVETDDRLSLFDMVVPFLAASFKEVAQHAAFSMCRRYTPSKIVADLNCIKYVAVFLVVEKVLRRHHCAP